MKKGIQCPPGTLRVVRVNEHEWVFEYARIRGKVYERLHDAIEHWEAGYVTFPERTYRQLINEYPEFIDAYHHLALLLSEKGKQEKAFQMWQEVVSMGLSCLPPGFEMGRDRLPWGILDNRPFLRAYHGLGLEYLARGHTEKALEIFNNILAVNPNDNQGARALLIDCYFRLNHPQEVLAVCNRYPHDAMEQLLYGRVLALYQLGRKVEAERALKEAIEYLPRVGKELIKERHRKPSSLRPGRITHGGQDQAYYYWVEQGKHWQKTPGALEFVRQHLKHQRLLG